MTPLAGWGRYPVVAGEERLSEDLEAATLGATLSRGLGRSYGDASLPAAAGGTVAGTRLADRVLAFDEETGTLHAEAGLSLARINELFRPRCWSSPVLPGTRFVTLGGMVAADVHGKNHHVNGAFGAHVEALRMRGPDGSIADVSDASDPELFRATIGGMGLTGHVLEVRFRMERIPSPWIYQEVDVVDDLHSLISALREAGRDWPFTVCWADCVTGGRGFGRGALIKGRWADPSEAPAKPPAGGLEVSVPFEMPGWLLNRPLGRAFNTAYRLMSRVRGSGRLVSPDAFFHPLDGLLHWNRLYGRRGFTQYQCVVPDSAGPDGYRALFDRLAHHGGGSFLTVVKDCGPEGRGMLSFPMPGISAAFDLPMIDGWTREVVNDLNRVVIDSGGRIYLAKDVLTRAGDFREMEPRFPAWDAFRRSRDPRGRIRSALSERLFGDGS
jgi:FAD/FMN-containing dehydrogenase